MQCPLITLWPHLYCDFKSVCPAGFALSQQVVTCAMEVIHAAIKGLVVGVPPGSAEAWAGSVCAQPLSSLTRAVVNHTN